MTVPRHAAGGPSSGKRSATGKFFGALGELLISAGVLLVLFLVWQLWWSDVQAAQAQAALQAEVSWLVPLDELPLGESVDQQDPQFADPPVLSLPDAEGDLFATLLVPAWGADYERTVHQGVDKRIVLDPLGIGHFREAAGPGEQGNFALAAHRTTFGRPFHNMHDLAEGDAVVVRTEDTWYVYRITVGPYIVDPYQVGVVAQVPFLAGAGGETEIVRMGADGGGGSGGTDGAGAAAGASGAGAAQEELRRLITLVACHPLYSAAQRIVVHGELEYWQPVSAGVPPELLSAQLMDGES